MQTHPAQTEEKLSIHMQSGYAAITISGTVNTTYSLQSIHDLPATNGWGTLTNVVLPTSPWAYIDYTSLMSAKRFYRVVGTTPSDTNTPAGMVLIPAGTFTMGDSFNEGEPNERPTRTVNVSAFYMDRTEVTKSLWDQVMTWAAAHGYGLYDMAGNVWEWCWNYLGPSERPVRGASWHNDANYCRVSYRLSYPPQGVYDFVGFRSVLSPAP